MNAYESELGQSVSLVELYDHLELTPTYYNRWIKKEVLDNPYFESGIDFCTKVQVNKSVGRNRVDYHIHIDSAKKLCMVSKSAKGNEIRNELVQLTKNVEQGLLVSREQINGIMRMVKVFSIYEYRKLATKKNCENYISKAVMVNPAVKDSSFIYGQFHQWRNEALNLGKEALSQRVKEYCMLEQKRIPNNFTQDQALTMMGEYEMIKNAIWDLLSSQNKSEEMIKNICLIATDIAKEMKPYLQRLNESDLFFAKIDQRETKMIGL